MSPTRLIDIRTVAVAVRDADAALAFYRDVLGFEVRRDLSPTAGQRWIEMAPPGAAVTVALVPGPGVPGSDTGIRFAVSGAPAEHEALSAKGVAVGELLRWPGVPAMFSFTDPDGNRFYVVDEAR